MRGHFGIVIALVLAVSPHPSPASALGRSAESSCERSLANAVLRQVPGAIPQRCWRVGPIKLGMTEEDVERRLGAPVARSSGAASTATLYAFPFRGGSLVVNGRARFRMAELRFIDKRLIAIDNDPPSTTTSSSCSAEHIRGRLDGVDLAARAGPLLRIVGTGVGEPLSQLRKRFGRAPARNRSSDWYNYLPIPLSFDVDGNRITGFEVARDGAALTSERPEPKVYLQRVPATCELTGINFVL
jgi:hypothetical protein